MNIQGFFWDEWNVVHIARHNVRPEEVEEIAFDDDPVVRKHEKVRFLYGKTIDGRYLFTVYVVKGPGLAWVITSRDMDERERRLYKSHVRKGN